MQDSHSGQMLSSESDQLDLKAQDIAEDLLDPKDENTDSVFAVIEMKLSNLMTQREVEILTTLFPETAQTLAAVLRNRPYQL